MSYRLGLLSEIPVVEQDGRFWTLDLWAQDLQAQSQAVAALTLMSPALPAAPQGWQMLPLPASIRVVALERGPAAIARAVAEVDVVQLPGNFTWRRSGRARALLRAARRAGKPVVLGISSDRATTMIVNARGQNVLRRARARLDAASVMLSQRYLATRCDGTFLVGEGLRRLVERDSSNIFVGTASWIRASDIRPATAARRDAAAIRLCAAARLEPMKGIVLALEALAALRAEPASAPLALTIAGQGAEEASLRARSAALELQEQVTFAGTFAYPGPFFEFLRSQDIVLLTNLNDEQPRLVFDAISQGCLIVCPDSLPYRGMGIPEALLYRRGDAGDLARATRRAIGLIGDPALRATLDALARAATIETMHDRRREWIEATVLARPSARDALLAR